MRTEYKFFAVVTGYLLVVSVLYWLWSGGLSGTPEWAGLTALLLAGLLALSLTLYFWFVSRRIHPRPEDRPDAEVDEGAGEVGFFSPGSYWPFGIGLAAAAAAYGIVLWQWWLLAAGLIALLFAVGGLLFEYYTGSRRTA